MPVGIDTTTRSPKVATISSPGLSGSDAARIRIMRAALSRPIHGPP